MEENPVWPDFGATYSSQQVYFLLQGIGAIESCGVISGLSKSQVLLQDHSVRCAVPPGRCSGLNGLVSAEHAAPLINMDLLPQSMVALVNVHQTAASCVGTSCHLSPQHICLRRAPASCKLSWMIEACSPSPLLLHILVYVEILLCSILWERGALQAGRTLKNKYGFGKGSSSKWWGMQESVLGSQVVVSCPCSGEQYPMEGMVAASFLGIKLGAFQE